MTAAGQGARHHLLGIPAEIRSIILSILFGDSPAIHLYQHMGRKYFNFPLELFWICRTLRAEALPHFAMAPDSNLRIWLDTPFDYLTRSVPPGLLAHLECINFEDAPTTEILDSLAQLPRLHTVRWRGSFGSFSLCDNPKLPHSIDQKGRTDALDGFLMMLLELDHQKFFYSHALRDIPGGKGRLKNLLQERYSHLQTKLNLVLLFGISLDVIHPKEECEGCLYLVSNARGSACCFELTCSHTGHRIQFLLLENTPHEGNVALRSRLRCSNGSYGDRQGYPMGWRME